jgi:tetratricopeptide (TPR) repeat protein
MAPHVRRFTLVLVVSLNLSAPAQPPASPAVAKALAVQDALRRGRELIQQGQALEAVALLEEQLPFINGNSNYLGLLREAYGEAIKKLQLEHKDEQAAELQKRSKILERSAGRPETVRGASADGAAYPAAQCTVPPTAEASLAAADKAFAERRYRQANELFAKAFAECPCVKTSHGGPWAYCKLHTVHERLTRDEDTLDAAKLGDCELEIAAALSMSTSDSKLTGFGKQLLDDIRRRKGSIVSVKVEVKHVERGADGWARAETPNFRLLHAQPRERAEQIVRAAENARASAILKWAGESRGAWNPVCEIFLHATAAEYARDTGKGEQSPGHATYQLQGGSIVRRRLDLRADDPNLISHVVPHETTHLVLGDLFGEAPLPRWADEGMAVLAEPRSQVERYARTLHRCRAQGELVHLAQLMQRSDYPEAAGITAFYVESVSIVDYLVGERDAKTLVQFLRDIQRGKVDAALQEHYQCSSVAELEARWLRKLFPGEIARASAGQ